MYDIDITRVPITEDELWDALEEQFSAADDILRCIPVQTREDFADPDWDPELGGVIRYRSGKSDARDFFLERGRELLSDSGQSIAEKKLSPEFIYRWGLLMFCHGYVTSYVLDDSNSNAFLRGGRALAKKTLVRRKFIAHLLLPLLESGVPRPEAEEQVAESIKQIIKRGRFAGEFGREWFERFLTKQGLLRSTFGQYSLSKRQMRELCREPVDDIPPVHLILT